MNKSKKLKPRAANNSLRLLISQDIYNLLFVAFLMVASIATAIMNGPDLGWDIKNYHFYVGYQFLHGGFERNLFPAQLQGWFNPLMDALQVALIENLPPILATAALAFLQSLTMPLLYILIRQSSTNIVAGLSPVKGRLLWGATLLIGTLGAMTLCELGASFGDLLVSVPLLASLVILGQVFTTKDAAKNSMPWLAFAGFLFGVAVGLKLTVAVFAPGFVIIICCLQQRPLRLMQNLACFGCASLTGLLLTDGFWLWHLYATTGNPFFPAMNGLFHSNWISADRNLLDTRFHAHSLTDFFAYPIASLRGRHPGAEVPYYDLRFVVTCALFPVALYQMWCKRLTDWPLALTLFFYTGFIFWLALFGIMRYAVVLEFLSGIVLMLVMSYSVKKDFRVTALGAMAVLLLFTTQAPQWTPHLDWHAARQEKNWFGVTVPESLKGSDQMFLMLTDTPLSYVIPFFPEDAQFVRLEGNIDLLPGSVLYDTRLKAIAEHKGDFLTFAPYPPTTAQQGLLDSYGLLRTSEPCIPLSTNSDMFYACRLKAK